MEESVFDDFFVHAGAFAYCYWSTDVSYLAHKATLNPSMLSYTELCVEDGITTLRSILDFGLSS